MKWLQVTHRFVKLSNSLHVVCNTFGVHVTSRTSLDSSSGVLKYRSSTYAIIFLWQIYETAGFNIPNIGSRGLEVYFCFLMAMSHFGLQSWRVTHIQISGACTSYSQLEVEHLRHYWTLKKKEVITNVHECAGGWSSSCHCVSQR